ncbi:MAG: hypothetical protein ABJF23_17510, partial [Bryobacteraceae bacterium]
MNIRLLPALLVFAGIAAAQTSDSREDSTGAPEVAKAPTSAKRDVGSGAADIGKGAAKGLGSAAAGAGRAAGDLATLHPINAATDLGVAAVNTGRHVGTG